MSRRNRGVIKILLIKQHDLCLDVPLFRVALKDAILGIKE